MKGEPMRRIAPAALVLALAASARAQDQQLGARTKAMGGSYTAFEDDPVSVWLNPAGIATQPSSGSIAYQTYTTYPLHQERAAGATAASFSAEAETTFVDPALIPSYLGFVFHAGPPDSGMAVGLCYARPYHLNYSFDRVDDPFQTSFVPDSNVDQSFSRFRIAFAKDFRFAEAGQPAFLPHLSVGLGLDLGYERWEFKSAAQAASDNATAFGGGLGLLLGLYDDTESFRLNLGLAWQSAIRWNFNIDPDLLPAFDMPQQINFGLTAYLLQGTPLRMTADFQWIDWSETADAPRFAGREEFEDAVNFSLGAEYKIDLGGKVVLYPRAGFRRFDAPWSDEDDLPMTSNYQLVLDTEGEAFNLFTFGFGLSWSSDEGKVRTVDVAGDVGGDSHNFAMGFTYEF
jgi:long-subunit fatty acid transport protein